MDRIVLEIRGGIVCAAYSNKNIIVEIMDFDNMEPEGATEQNLKDAIKGLHSIY